MESLTHINNDFNWKQNNKKQKSKKKKQDYVAEEFVFRQNAGFGELGTNGLMLLYFAYHFQLCYLFIIKRNTGSRD